MYKDKILALLQSAVAKEFNDLIEVFSPQLSEHGDYSTNIAFVLAGRLKKSPTKIAEEIKNQLLSQPSKQLKKIEIASPGYINFFLSDEAYLEGLDRILAAKDNYGAQNIFAGKKIMVEFGHPNPFKTIHIGHLRNLCLGESICRLLEFQGAEVIRTNYQGDVGMHVAKCIWALRKINKAEYPQNIDERMKLLADCYVKGAAAFEQGGKAKAEIMQINKQIYQQDNAEVIKLWQLGVKWSLDKFRQIYKRLETHFDREYMESETLELGMQAVKAAIEKGILVKSQGAIVFPGEKYGLDTRVFLNAEGLLTYEGKELGLAQMEFSDYGRLDLCIHNVAVEQISFFKVTFKVEELLNEKMFKGRQYHHAYEFVGLKKGKMSSRFGQVVTAESILNEAHKRIQDVVSKNKAGLTKEDVEAIAVGAVKYSFLKMSPFKYLAFDIEESLSFSGDSGPYLQYTFARCRSVLRKAAATGRVPESRVPVKELGVEERAILKRLMQFEEVVAISSQKYDPHYIAVYLNDLAASYNSFYNKEQILGSRNEVLRLRLTAAVATVLKNGLYLLGIRTLERM